MVWFDCECGESLKKPSVGKHFLSKRCNYITCVDCNTTFHGTEYELHTRCISEAQKYMGKLYDADSVKREGAKQDSWIDAVYDALQEYEGPMKYLVEKLAMYDNIPRKQKAFVNFVSNSLNLKREPQTAEKLWNIVSQATANIAQARETGPSMQTSKPWTSFKDETIDILRANGGSMNWKLLQANLCKRRRVTHPEEDPDRMRFDVLANIPIEFLSSTKPVVSLE